MVKKIVVAGCRSYKDYRQAKEFISTCLSEYADDTIFILSGGCFGADKFGEMYAAENGFSVEIYSADWERYGRAAGPKRNREMAKDCDEIICFWDGKSRGTKSLIEYGRKFGKKVIIKNI